MSSETKTFIVKHDFGGTTVTLPKEGIILTIRITTETFIHLAGLLVIMGMIAATLIQLIVK
jgi:hypothetical protein